MPSQSAHGNNSCADGSFDRWLVQDLPLKGRSLTQFFEIKKEQGYRTVDSFKKRFKIVRAPFCLLTERGLISGWHFSIYIFHSFRPDPTAFHIFHSFRPDPTAFLHVSSVRSCGRLYCKN